MYMNSKKLYRQFIKEYSDVFDYAYRYVLARVRHVEIAEDIVSEVFVKAMEKLHLYDASKGSIRQWITGIMKRCLLDYWKRQVIVVPLEEFTVSSLPQFDQLAFDHYIDHLPPHIRQLLLWHFVDDYTYAQIAELTNKQPAAVRKYFTRVYKQLQEHYEER